MTRQTKPKRRMSFRRVDGSAGNSFELSDDATRKDVAAIRKLYADNPDFEETTRGEITCICGKPLSCNCIQETRVEVRAKKP